MTLARAAALTWTMVLTAAAQVHLILVTQVMTLLSQQPTMNN